MIKNVVFDFGSVLAKGHSADILDQLDVTNEEKEYLKKKFFESLLELDLGKTTIEEHYIDRKIVIRDEIKDRVIHYYEDREYDEELLKIVEKLKKNNYKFYILSNNNREVREYVTNLPIFKKHLDGYVFSCDYCMIKPNDDIYLKLLEKYNLKAEECIFVDDKKENVETSIKLGFKGFVYSENPNELYIFMIENGVILD